MACEKDPFGSPAYVFLTSVHKDGMGKAHSSGTFVGCSLHFSINTGIYIKMLK